MTVIELPDDQAAALKAKAVAEGLSLEAWIQKVAEQPSAPRQPRRHISEIIRENMSGVPPEIMATMSTDGACKPEELGLLAKQLASAPDAVSAARIRERLAHGFYGS